ncbi:hypothetical protein ACFPIJ_61400 [Dactylosporangium cerinum]|uniref:Ankyrin repeat domain-containing protein n=1 Tax=Dactylosporangium cerinum TaxID=1434730 RepID=A0ABV9WL98_9ACTN
MSRPRRDLAAEHRLRRTPTDVILAAQRARLAGDWRAACAAAGIAVTAGVAAAAFVPDLALQFLAGRGRYALAGSAGPLVLTVGAGMSRLDARPVGADVTWLPEWCWSADAGEARAREYAAPTSPVVADEVAALAAGLIQPDELHPLVRAALFPGLFPDDPPDRPTVTTRWDWPVVPVRCVGVWHGVRLGGGTLSAVVHPETIEAELAAPDGGRSACAEVIRAWRCGHGWLPRRLRDQRDEFFATVGAGRSGQAIAMLDAGFDPGAFDGEGRRAVHLLRPPTMGALLPRLPAVDAPDRDGRTALHHARMRRDDETAALLLAAGADPGRRDVHGRTPDEALRHRQGRAVRRRAWLATISGPPAAPPRRGLLRRLFGRG